MSSPHSQLPHTFENMFAGYALWMTVSHSPACPTSLNLLTVIQPWSVIYL